MSSQRGAWIFCPTLTRTVGREEPFDELSVDFLSDTDPALPHNPETSWEWSINCKYEIQSRVSHSEDGSCLACDVSRRDRSDIKLVEHEAPLAG